MSGIRDADIAKAFGYTYLDTNGCYYAHHANSHDFDVICDGMYSNEDDKNVQFMLSLEQIKSYLASDEYYLTRPF